MFVGKFKDNNQKTNNTRIHKKVYSINLVTKFCIGKLSTFILGINEKKDRYVHFMKRYL